MPRATPRLSRLTSFPIWRRYHTACPAYRQARQGYCIQSSRGTRLHRCELPPSSAGTGRCGLGLYHILSILHAVASKSFDLAVASVQPCGHG